MSTIANKWATLSYPRSAPIRKGDAGLSTQEEIEKLAKRFVSRIHNTVAARKLVLDAFAVFEPEAIGLEIIINEIWYLLPECSIGDITDMLADMIERQEVTAHTEDFVFLRDGTRSDHVAFPVDDDELSICESKTMYRLNKEWKER